MTDPYKKRAEKKLQLYIAACYLFENGKSYPQTIEMLSEHEPDDTIVAAVVEKAMNEEWDKLFEEARTLFAQGYPYDKVVKIISQKEPDLNIAELICDKWYEVKTRYMECIVDGPTNRTEGLKWVIICSLILIFSFIIDAHWCEYCKGARRNTNKE